MSVSKILTILVTLCIIGSATATKWTQCGQGSFQIKNASLSPVTIYPGNSARFTIDIVGADNDISAGKINMLVRLAGFPIYTEADDLCTKTECPVVAKTETQIIFEQSFPEITPRGSYSVTLAGKSAAGDQLFCVIISFHVTAPPKNFNGDDGTSAPSTIRTNVESNVGGELARFLKSRKALYPNQY
jgi:hypothetical protein